MNTFQQNIKPAFILIIPLLLLIFGITETAVSQDEDFCDFYAPGTIWYFQLDVPSGLPNINNSKYSTVEMLKDTVVNGDSAKKITFTCGCSLIRTNVIKLRNDSLFYFAADSNEFRLVYDYTAGKGEQWDVVVNYAEPWFEHPTTDTFTITVDSVGTTTIAGHELTVQHVSHSSRVYTGGYEEGKITKYLGAGTCLFLGDNQMCKPVTSALRCYINDSCGIDHNTGIVEKCDTVFQYEVSVEEGQKQEKGLRVYPNPAHDELTVEMKNAHAKEHTVILLNTSGAEVLRRPITDSRLQLNTKDLPAGMYFLQLKKEGRLIDTRKLVIH